MKTRFKLMRTIADKIETIISQYPLIQYAFCATSELVFSEKVRHICETECERYGKSWSCPPGVGEVEECRKCCQDYDRVLLYTTQAEVTDSSIFSEALASRTSHEEITREMLKEFREAGISCFALSGDSCQICSKCAYPDSCRHPDMAIPCIESYGILVVDLTEKYQIDFYTDMHTVTWFGLIFYREKDRE